MTMPTIPAATLIKIALGAIAVALLAGFLTLRSCHSAGTAKTEAKLATGQAGAAIQSGADMGTTLGNRQAADAAGDETVMETKDAIDQATDAGAVTGAGRAGLCGLAGNRGKPECLRKPAP